LHTPFTTWPSFVLYSNQLTYIEYEASNIYTASAFQAKSIYSVGERYFHSFHYISVWTKTSIYQFRRFGLTASWIVGELVCRRIGLSASWWLANWFVGQLVCRRVGLSASWWLANWFVGELVCRRVGGRRIGLSASWSVGELVVGELSINQANNEFPNGNIENVTERSR